MKPSQFLKSIVVFFLFLVVLIAACDDDDVNDIMQPTPDECNSVTATYAEANAIIQANCATSISCHGAGSSRGPGPLETYDQIFNARNDVRSAVASGSMPRGRTLNRSQKNTIICWIESGATQ